MRHQNTILIEHEGTACIADINVANNIIQHIVFIIANQIVCYRPISVGDRGTDCNLQISPIDRCIINNQAARFLHILINLTLRNIRRTIAIGCVKLSIGRIKRQRYKFDS